MAENVVPSIITERGPSRQVLSFDGPEDVIAFLDHEQEFWSWVKGEVIVNNGNTHGALSLCAK